MGHCTRPQLYNYCPCTTVGPQPAYARSPKLIHKRGGPLYSHYALYPWGRCTPNCFLHVGSLHPRLAYTRGATGLHSVVLRTHGATAPSNATNMWGHCTQQCFFHVGATAPRNASYMWVHCTPQCFMPVGPLHPIMLPTRGGHSTQTCHLPVGHCTQSCCIPVGHCAQVLLTHVGPFLPSTASYTWGHCPQ